MSQAKSFSQCRVVEIDTARSLLAALIGVTAILIGGRAAKAQEAWSPIVVTSPGGVLNPQVTEPPMRVERADGEVRIYQAPRAQAETPPSPLPQGVWSPLITGAIPSGRAVQPGEVRSAPSGMPVSPIRPAAPGQTVAASDAAKPATAPAGAPSQPARDPGTEAAPDAQNTFFKKPGPLDALPPNATAAQQYCFNTADSAAEARFAWQAKKIQEMEAELDKRSQRLEAKTQEYKEWLERRDAFSRKAHEKLVGFYSRMRPDAAAVQLATIDENVAAAVMTKLETKVASQIMGEMDPERAAKIATIISGAAKISAPSKPAAPQNTSGAPGEAMGAEQSAAQPRS